MEILKHAHSGLRWIFLLIIIFAIVNAFRKWKSGEKFEAKDKLLNILTLALTHTMGIIGIVLLFISPKVQFTEGFMKNDQIRFYLTQHTFGMVLVLILITIGYSKAKKAEEDKAKFKKTAVWFTISLLIVLISIPWPFWGVGGELY
jgi:cellobiose-specific phosphotransferase system component IIC|tara:strand:- start:594 stop:1031 length:438 start_codon:yes stop_codon:yes gene_type:complete